MPTNRNHVPPRPTGDGPFGNGAFIRFMQAAWDRLWGAEGRFIDTSTVRVEQTTRGIAFHAAPQKASSRATDVSATLCTIILVTGDYLICQDSNGQTINVAKHGENRTSNLAEVIDGVTVNYTYTDSNNRRASDGFNIQDEVLYRRYVGGQTILAIKPTGGTGVAFAPEWIESANRVWLRKRIQSV